MDKKSGRNDRNEILKRKFDEPKAEADGTSRLLRSKQKQKTTIPILILTQKYSNNIKNKRKLLIYNKIEIHKGINPSKNVCRKNTISTPLVSPPVLQSLDASVRRQGTVPSFLETDTLRASVSLDRPCLSLPSVSLQSITGSPSKRKPAFNGTFS